MAIGINIPEGLSAPKTKALEKQLRDMNSQLDQGEITHSDLQDAAIGGLISVVARIEADVEKLKRDDQDARLNSRF